MTTNHSDDALLSLVSARGYQMANLFLVGGKVYATSDPSSLESGTTYAPLEGMDDSVQEELVELLKRLDAVTYPSIEAVDAEILSATHWEAIYSELDSFLSKLSFASKDRHPTYCIVDYGSGQHKVECEAQEYFDASVIEAIQSILRKHTTDWEVILVGGNKLGPHQALSIYPNHIVQRWSNARYYDDA